MSESLFGRALKKAMEREGISAEELSKTLGYHPNHVPKFIKGTAFPGKFMIAKMAEVLHADAEEWEAFVLFDRVKREEELKGKKT